MNTKHIVAVVVVVIFIVLAVMLLNSNDGHRNDLSRSLDKAADNIEEGVHDAQRGVEDALD